MNAHNYTNIVKQIDFSKVHVGRGMYGDLNIVDYNPSTGKSKVKIGNYCSIADDVTFLLGGGHNLHTFSTYPFQHFIFNKEESGDKGDIVIGDDVWIGTQVAIMSGVKIGQGAVIGAKALVNKDIPPYAIAVGIPAKVIKYRFNSDLIKKLEKFDFAKLDEKKIESNIDLLSQNLTDENLKLLEKRINE